MCSCVLALCLNDDLKNKKKQKTKNFCIVSVIFHSVTYPHIQVDLIMVVVRFQQAENLEVCRVLSAHISANLMFL